ncbi:MAG: hypothetical protein NTY32_03260 [Bacteroidia bacterium]|nr:hypothetical protein [Bacteroidia bacterium]
MRNTIPKRMRRVSDIVEKYAVNNVRIAMAKKIKAMNKPQRSLKFNFFIFC